MKCRVCREPAVIDLPRHNANFCVEHLVRFCRDQVGRAIEQHEMIAKGERVLVAVSGGKDSLALWDLLLDAGYAADGLYIGLGIGSYSDESGTYARAFASRRSVHLVEIDLRADLGYDVPTAAAATRRVPCSACGMTKRHLFDRAARDGGYDVVATGHNLDDEAAVLFGNTLRWDAGYLGRQRPVLPEGQGFPRKVKPLVRLTERETAAYCIVRGIDYIVEECPMAAGNKHLGYKEALNLVEVRSPGAKAAFYQGFLERGLERFAPDAADERLALHSCPSCGAPTTNDGVCAFCRLVATSAAHAPVAVDAPPAAASMSGPFVIGDRVVLVDTKSRHYLVTLRAGAEFHTHSGYIGHDEIAGRQEGATFKATKGMLYTAMRPTLEDFVLLMPRGAQVIYPKDLGPILMLADIAPGVRVLESGVGSGALSMAMLRCGAIITGYEIRDDFANRARANVGSFLGDEILSRYDVQLRDCYEGIDERGLDRVVLDLPEPWQVVPHAERSLRPGGILCAYTPSVVQVMQLRESLRGAAWIGQRTVEVLQRGWHVDGQAVRPDHRMVAHTGFLTVARFLSAHE